MNVAERILVFLLLFIGLTMPSNAQTPIANRVHAMAKAMEKKVKVVAKYTDNERHSLYYVARHRLYRWDALTNATQEVSFANNSYDTIIEAWISPDGNIIIVGVDRKSQTTQPLKNGQQVWKLDTRTGQNDLVGEGFSIERRKDCYVVKQATRCINPDALPERQRWMAKDHYYYLDGKVIWSKEEYEIK